MRASGGAVILLTHFAAIGKQFAAPVLRAAIYSLLPT
jgi:hypothetical protein